MKLKNCDQCGKPFPVIEPGDDPAQLDQGTTYLAAAAKVCLECHRFLADQAEPTPHHAIPDECEVGRDVFGGDN